MLKREQIKRRIYESRGKAWSDVFDNPKRRHSFTEKLSPIEFERRYFLRQDGL